MKEELKLHLIDLYKRQQEELSKLTDLRLRLFEKENFNFMEEVQELESFLAEFNKKITSYFQDDYLTYAEHRADRRKNPWKLHDDVD
jgi:phosphoglycerate-specific signal transduction histidine kinase